MSDKRTKQGRHTLNPTRLVSQAIKILAASGKHPAKKNGRLVYETTQKTGGYWIYIRHNPENNCTLWNTFIYMAISKQLPQEMRFIPSPCQGCYKVFARPETYDDFLNLYEIMKAKLDYSSKIGIEKREDVDALYGAYWYCRGKTEGLDRLDEVRRTISYKAFLKRGCTEYERAFGPSDRWEVKPHQIAIEAEVKRRVYIDNTKQMQTLEDIENIMGIWAKFAKEVGPDYKGTHSYVTYER